VSTPESHATVELGRIVGIPGPGAKANSRERRDLTIIPIDSNNCLVIACDSCGAVGGKAADILKLPPRYAAKFATRVALTEVMCAGAVPIAITNGIISEMNPTGAEMIQAIGEEARLAGFPDIAITGSTEENFPTAMTGLAITVIGMCPTKDLRFAQAQAGDKFVLLGTPKVGAEVDLECAGFYKEIARLLQVPGVREIVPVGSKGVGYEIRNLAKLHGADIEIYDTGVDLCKSAGPVSCLVVLCAEGLPTSANLR